MEDFVEYLNMLQTDDKPLNIEKDSEKMNAVQLTTYQSAKGLEYEYVYMPSLKPRKWESSSKPIIKPAIPLSKEDRKDSGTWESFKRADKINKMYVGMTRAKHTLRLSYVGGDGTEGYSKLLKINEIPKEYLEINNYCNDEKEIRLYKWANALTSENYDYNRDFKSNIDIAINKIKYFSPSLVNPYIKCPRMFFFNNILKLNSPNFSIPDALNFGLSVHKACENAVKFAKKNGEFWNSEVFVQELKTQIKSFPFSSYKQKEQYENIAETTIKEFYEKHLSLIKIDSLYTFENNIIADFEGVQFKGLPDMIILDNRNFKIFDYKTGQAKNGKEICLTDPKDEKSGTHEDYYIQMGLYKYFLEKTDSLKRKVEETTFLFPQDYEHPYSVNYTEDDINKILDKYKYAINGIKSRNFEPTPSKVSCMYCPYKNDLCNLNH